MDAILAALATVLGTGVLSVIGAFATGRFVPASRVDAAVREAEKQIDNANREAEKWRTAFEEIRRAHDQQSRLLDRLQMSAEITDNVMRALAEGKRSRPSSGPVGLVTTGDES